MGVQPVSYTHLDVYKRQEQIFTVAYITFHKCHMVLSIEFVDISISLEITVFRRHVHYRLTLHQLSLIHI